MANFNKNRILYFDVLNVVACIAVIFLHHNGLVHLYRPSVTGQWSQALAVEVLAFFAVPIFLMLTGATLMEYRKRYDTRTFFRKRFSRVLIPFIIWSFIVFVYAILNGQYTVSELTPQLVLNSLLTQESMSVYWFFPVIIAIYLAMPILSLLTKSADRKWLWYMVGLGVLTYSVIPPVVKALDVGINTGYQFPLTGGAGYVIYPILGYLLATEKKLKKQWVIALCVLSVICLIFRYVITYMFTVRKGASGVFLSDYVYITSMIPSVTVFVLARLVPWKNYIKDRFVPLLATVSSCSLGIYLIHMMILHAEFSILKFDSDLGLKWRILMPVVTYLVSLGIVLLVKRTPVIRNLFP